MAKKKPAVFARIDDPDLFRRWQTYLKGPPKKLQQAEIQEAMKLYLNEKEKPKPENEA